MARQFPLQSLLEHVRHRRDAAERLLRMLKRREDAALVKLEELRGYKGEYQRRLAGDGARGLEIYLLRDFHVFLGKLDIAIRDQAAEVDKIRGQWGAAQENWFALRRKVKAFETLAQRHQSRELAKEERLDQRTNDEAALLRHLKRATTHLT